MQIDYAKSYFLCKSCANKKGTYKKNFVSA
jgi:hypothetical protein